MGKYSKRGANHRADYDIYDRPCYSLGHALDCRITRTMPELIGGTTMATINLVGICRRPELRLYRGIMGHFFVLECEDNGYTYYVHARNTDILTKLNEGSRVSVWCNKVERICGALAVEAVYVLKPEEPQLGAME